MLYCIGRANYYQHLQKNVNLSYNFAGDWQATKDWQNFRVYGEECRPTKNELKYFSNTSYIIIFSWHLSKIRSDLTIKNKPKNVDKS
jgi:hypothetical protein